MPVKERIAKLRDISPTRWFSYLLFALSGVILCIAIYLTASIDVLKDWHLDLPNQSIHAGDTIVVDSIYNKTVNVSGTSTRYIECRSNGIFIRYPISSATANRAAGTGGTGITLRIPTTIPDLPTTCRISISIQYDLFFWRHSNESVSSKEFILLPAPSSDSASTSSAPASDPVLQQTSPVQQGQGERQSVVNNSYSYPQSTPVIPSDQQDISQQVATPAPQQDKQTCTIDLLGIKLLCS